MQALPLPGRGVLRPAAIAAALALFVALGIALLPSGGVRPSVPAAPPLDRAAAIAAVRHLPLSFEENAGQAPEGVRFVARSPGFALALDGDGSQLRLGAASLKTRFVGGRPAAVDGVDARHTRTNYFTGASPADWHTGVRTFGAVRYGSVWPGIDVAFHGTGRQLEYDYILSPGADPGQIAQSCAAATAPGDPSALAWASVAHTSAFPTAAASSTGSRPSRRS